MLCSKCGTEVPDDSQFCRKCGQSVGVSSVAVNSGGAAAAMAPAKPIDRPVSKRTTLFVLLGILALVLVWGGVSLSNHKAIEKAPTASVTLATPPVVIRHMTLTAVDKPFIVPPHEFIDYQFSIPPKSSNVHILGHFAASGGSGNDIEVYVTDEDGYANLKNRHDAVLLYDSGRVTQGTIDMELPSDPKTYRLVFNNAFALLSNKAVTADAKVDYDQRQ